MKRLLVFVALLIVALSAFAYDFRCNQAANTACALDCQDLADGMNQAIGHERWASNNNMYSCVQYQTTYYELVYDCTCSLFDYDSAASAEYCPDFHCPVPICMTNTQHTIMHHLEYTVEGLNEMVGNGQ